MVRDDAKSSALRRRPSRTVPATIAATLLTAAGVAGVWAAGQRLGTGAWPSWVGQTHTWAATHNWGSWIVVAISIAVALLGLLLLLTALRPGMPNAYQITPPPGTGDVQGRSTDFVMTRRSVAKLANAHAALVEGVESVSASVTSRKVTMTVQTASAQTAQIEQRVTHEVNQALAAVGLSPQPTVRASARTTKP